VDLRANAFIQSYFDAWNHSDAKGVAEHLSQNGTYFDIPTNEQHTGEDLVDTLTSFFASERNHYKLIGDVLSNEKTLAFEYKALPMDREADGWFGAEFMTLQDAGVVRIIDYYDQVHSVGGPLRMLDQHAPKYAKSGLDTEQIERYLLRLKHLMGMDKVYLESELTMPKLADLVNCSVNHLSQAVNSGFGMSFFDFINSYRIEEAKLMLQHNDSQAQAILDVSFAVGFNSNSAFYAAFKKSTGQTPAQFRRRFVEK
jgi:AraC-like DNA-binding protein|tara:strand:+ start:3388 stop:4155 length:768 start_codon:yes stop_codon:yes gene_type:complete